MQTNDTEGTWEFVARRPVGRPRKDAAPAAPPPDNALTITPWEDADGFPGRALIIHDGDGGTKLVLHFGYEECRAISAAFRAGGKPMFLSSGKSL